MPISPESIQDPASTVPANSEEASGNTGGLPEEILSLPVFKLILEGSPAALFTPTGDKSVEATTAIKFQKPLSEAGIFLYRDKPSGLDLIFNGRFVSKELLDAASKKGKLETVASPLAATVAQLSGAAAPAAGGEAVLPAAGAPSPVPVDSALNTQRVDNLTAGGPTSGNFPGAGRVLNNITQNAV